MTDEAVGRTTAELLADLDRMMLTEVVLMILEETAAAERLLAQISARAKGGTGGTDQDGKAERQRPARPEVY